MALITPVPAYSPTVPTVSTEGPLDVARWDDDTQTPHLDTAYNSAFGTTQQAIRQAAPQTLSFAPVKSQTPSLSDMAGFTLARKQAQQQAANAAKYQQGSSMVPSLGTLGKAQTSGFSQTNKSYIPKGYAGLSAYGVSKSGLANQKGSAPYGFQPDMWKALSGAFSAMKAAGLGTPGITDGWRSYESQVATKKAKGSLAATPGKSVHGIGYAADLALNGRQQRWMEANAWKYGLYRLASESWHWQLSPKGGYKGATR